jgi:PTH1 family peptidyl-tRNA hydrolase
MKLIVGLGNPGRRYQGTRHNIGFMVLDGLLQDLTPVGKTVWKTDKKTNSLVAKVGEVVLAKPQTMMNASGFAVTKLAGFYKVKPDHIWIVHDDLDLPLGKIKIKLSGGSAGHKGLESIIRQLDSDRFVRFRLGIGHPRRKPMEAFRPVRLRMKKFLGWQKDRKKVERHVLTAFQRKERKTARRLVKKAVEALKLSLNDGIDRAANNFN